MGDARSEQVDITALILNIRIVRVPAIHLQLNLQTVVVNVNQAIVGYTPSVSYLPVNVTHLQRQGGRKRFHFRNTINSVDTQLVTLG